MSEEEERGGTARKSVCACFARSAADAAIAALRRSRRVPYGGGLHSSSCTVPLPGVAGAELLDELRTLLGWPLDGEVPLALDDATEGVRRLLTLLYPRLPASDEGYWSEADCRLIARQVLASAGRSAGPQRRRARSDQGAARPTPRS